MCAGWDPPRLPPPPAGCACTSVTGTGDSTLSGTSFKPIPPQKRRIDDSRDRRARRRPAGAHHPRPTAQGLPGVARTRPAAAMVGATTRRLCPSTGATGGSCRVPSPGARAVESANSSRSPSTSLASCPRRSARYAAAHRPSPLSRPSPSRLNRAYRSPGKPRDLPPRRS
jgi:hypothetical protein